MNKTPDKLVKLHVLVDFGILRSMGHGCDTVCMVDADLAAKLVELGDAEYVAQPAPEPTVVALETTEAPAPETAMAPKQTRKVKT